MGQKARAPLISTCENPYIIHARVRLMRARIVWLGAACPPGETLALLPLPCAAIHASKERRWQPEGDICSVRECPNYS